MASRLSEMQVKSISDAGRLNLPWDAPKSFENLAYIDFKKIMQSENAEQIIASLPPQILYHSLKIHGPEECTEIFPYITEEQLIRILDYDVWQKDELSPADAFKWLRQFKAASGVEALCYRFQSLDEEYQIALLEKFVKIYDAETVETLTEEVREELFVLPCQKVFYEITSDDKDIIQFIHELIESALQVNLEYCYSLLAHASYVPPNEAQAVLNQFRRARLEEDGFYTFAESVRVFELLDLATMREAAKKNLATANMNIEAGSQLVNIDVEEQCFLDQIVNYHYASQNWDEEKSVHLHQGFLYLANCLAAAVHLEPSDLKGLNMLLEQEKALVSLGLEYLAEGDVVKGSILVRDFLPVQFFRTGLSVIYEKVQKPFMETIKTLDKFDFGKFTQLFNQRKMGELIWFMDREWVGEINFTSLEILKAAFNRFPMCPVEISDQSTPQLRFTPINGLRKIAVAQKAVQNIVKEIKVIH